MDNNTFDDILTEEDYREINEIKELRRKLITYINIDNMIKFIIEVIDNSEYISFKNERAKKFIDRKRPVYYITVDKDKCFNSDIYKPKKEKFKSEEEEASYYSNVVYGEMISKITEYINDYIRNKRGNETDLDNLKKYASGTSIFEDLPDLDNVEFYNRMNIISMMFAMRLEENNKNNIVVELLQ